MPQLIVTHRGASRRPDFPLRILVFCVVVACAAVPGSAEDEPVRSGQIEEVRRRIVSLQESLEGLERQSESTRVERERLVMELDLAEARVEELELVLTDTRNQIVSFKGEIAALADEIDSRKRALAKQLELVALLGKPGPLQLLWDGARGGDLEDAVSVVVTMAAGQARIVESLHQLQTERSRRLAELSIALERAAEESRELVTRREELHRLESQFDARLASLDRQRRVAGDRLAELREREEALERLLGIVAEKQRFTGREDIRRFRGALPWPAAGTIIRTFGKHFLPRYSTYTVCNGLRLDVERGTAVRCVFPGQVAFARHFKGYGNMVVVDHGREVFSLVAGLGSIQARLDQQVDMGTQLGLVGPKKEEGNLYFEIRVKGKPEDPKRWLQLDEGK